jgi:hypothetical protein
VTVFPDATCQWRLGEVSVPGPELNVTLLDVPPVKVTVAMPVD